jgi:hypothetical protein
MLQVLALQKAGALNQLHQQVVGGVRGWESQSPLTSAKLRNEAKPQQQQHLLMRVNLQRVLLTRAHLSLLLQKKGVMPKAAVAAVAGALCRKGLGLQVAVAGVLCLKVL